MIVSAAKPLRHYTWGAGCQGWELVDEPGLSVKKESMPPGSEEVLHYHKTAIQFFYILSGIATFTIDGQEVQVKENAGIEIMNGLPHKIKNNSEQELRFLLSSTPSTNSDRINLE